MTLGTRHYAGLLLGWVLLMAPAESRASWAVVERYLQPAVVVVHRDKTRLVLRCPDLPRDIVVARQPGRDVDIYSVFRRRGRSNPYRVWLATKRFVTDEGIPRKKWGHIFRTPFLRIVRTPESK